jgi:hypothetical protein
MISSGTLWDQFLALEQAEANAELFSTISIGSNEECFLYKNNQKFPVFLRKIEDVGNAVDFRLRYISVSFGVPYKVETDKNISKDLFIKVICEDSSSTLQRVFVNALGSILNNADTDSPEKFISVLIQLFSSRTDRRRSVIGIWGELAFLLQSKSIDQAILAWHNDPNQLRDFTFDSNVVEVKTTSGSSRTHSFNYEQLSNCLPADMLYSLKIEQSDLGLNCFELAEKISNEASNKCRPVFWQKFLASIDPANEDFEELRFNLERAHSSQMLIPLNLIARPEKPSQGIGNIRSINFDINFD